MTEIFFSLSIFYYITCTIPFYTRFKDTFSHKNNDSPKTNAHAKAHTRKHPQSSMSDEEQTLGKRKYGVRTPFIFRDPNKDATHRVPEYKFPAPDDEVMDINIIHCVAKESLIKCKGVTKNTERVFVIGDSVDVIYASLEEFNRAPDVYAWLLVTKQRETGTKKKLWLRSLELVRSKLEIVDVKTVTLKVMEHGLVRERRGTLPEIKCSSVVVDGGFTVWIEEGTFPITRFPPGTDEERKIIVGNNYVTGSGDSYEGSNPFQNAALLTEDLERYNNAGGNIVAQNSQREIQMFEPVFQIPIPTGYVTPVCYYYYYYDDSYPNVFQQNPINNNDFNKK